MIEKLENILRCKEICVCANPSRIHKDGRFHEEIFLYPFKSKPDDFLKFAKEDFNEKNIRGLINSLSNIKRAINCQIDLILFIFGYLNVSKKKRWNLPEKINFIRDLGIISPEIINKINKRRNLIEHEYDVPSEGEVSDAIGVAELFIESLRPIFYRYYNDMEIHDDTTGIGYPCIYIKFDYKKPVFKVAYEEKERTKIEEREFDFNDSNYLDIVKYYIKFLKMRY